MLFVVAGLTCVPGGAAAGAVAPLGVLADPLTPAPVAVFRPLWTALERKPGPFVAAVERGDESFLRSRAAAVDAAALPVPGGAMGATLVLPWFEDATVLGTVETVEWSGGGPRGSALDPQAAAEQGFTLGGVATAAGADGEPVAGTFLISVKRDALAGELRLADGRYFEIRFAGHDAENDDAPVHIVAERDVSRALRCGGPVVPSAAEVAAAAGAGAGAGSGAGETAVVPRGVVPAPTQIDAMILYTPAARAAHGGPAGIESIVDLSVAQTNQAFRNSGINAVMRLVYTGVADYDETGNASTDLQRLRITNDGFADGVHCLRDGYGADVVSLFCSNLGNGVGGLATILQAGNAGAFAPFAFSVVRSDQLLNMAFAHEFGHNAGCAHSRGPGEIAGRFSYSWGFRQAISTPSGQRFRDLMAYDPGSLWAGFSNPGVLLPSSQGVPIGVAVGQAEEAHNTQTITNTRTVAAGWRGAVAAFWPVQRVSTTDRGVQATSSLTSGIAFSPDAAARYVVFSSNATNLVAGDSNGRRDIFLLDRNTAAVSIVSPAASGALDGDCSRPSTTTNGNLVAFLSSATNLATSGPADTNGLVDAYVRDRAGGTTVRASLGATGNEGDGEVREAMVAGNGRYVVFVSTATNAVSGDTNFARDVFRRDLQTGTTVCVSVSTGGVPGNGQSDSASISADGRYVAFLSTASNLVPGDTNAQPDVFVRDMQLGVTTRLSVTPAGAQSAGVCSGPVLISGDGSTIVFASTGSDLVSGDTNIRRDVFARSRLGNITLRASLTDTDAQITTGDSTPTGVSSDGRYVAFLNAGNAVAAGDANSLTDAFLRDTTGSASPRTRRISRRHNTASLGLAVQEAAISAAGRFALFTSNDTVVPCDTNGGAPTNADLFLVDMTPEAEAAPANDLCAAATPLAVPSTVSGTTISATPDIGVSTACVADNGIGSPTGLVGGGLGVWYSLTGNGRRITLSLCTTSPAWNARMSVYSGAGGCSVVPLPCVAGDDDGCGGSGLPTLSFCSQVGVTYFVLVHGGQSAAGNFTLATSSGAFCTGARRIVPEGPCCAGGSLVITSAGGCAAREGTYLGDNAESGAVDRTYTDSPSIPIPDVFIAGVSRSLFVPDGFAPTKVTVSVRVDHTAIGDLRVSLSRGGTTVVLHNQTCELTDNLNASYDDDAFALVPPQMCSQPLTAVFRPASGSLAALTGTPASGAPWVLNVSDRLFDDVGTLVSWSLTLRDETNSLCACGLADVVSIGGFAPPDGQLTVDDYTSFINAFAAGEALADIVSIGGFPPSDGELTVDDYTSFVNAFAEGCG